MCGQARKVVLSLTLRATVAVHGPYGLVARVPKYCVPCCVGKEDCLVIDFTDQYHRLDRPSDLIVLSAVMQAGEGKQHFYAMHSALEICCALHEDHGQRSFLRLPSCVQRSLLVYRKHMCVPYVQAHVCFYVCAGVAFTNYQQQEPPPSTKPQAVEPQSRDYLLRSSHMLVRPFNSMP